MIDAPLVWDGGAQTGPIPSVLQTWAAARGLRLVLPRPGGRHAVAVDPALAARVEERLHAARELVTQHDADGAERALARGETLLLAHPELPEAPWLLAEVERGWAARFSRLEPIDAARAARAWRQADALDGGRLPGIGEPAPPPRAPSAPFSITLTGPSRSAELRFDGRVISPGAQAAPPGLHQLVATVDGRVVFAEWVFVVPHADVRVALPAPEPCSAEDLAGPAPACATFVRVRAGATRGAYQVCECERDGGCGPELAIAPVWTAPPEHHGVVRHGLPAWAAWTFAGAGVVLGAIAAGAIGWAALPSTTRTVFVTSKPQ